MSDGLLLEHADEPLVDLWGYEQEQVWQAMERAMADGKPSDDPEHVHRRVPGSFMVNLCAECGQLPSGEWAAR